MEAIGMGAALDSLLEAAGSGRWAATGEEGEVRVEVGGSVGHASSHAPAMCHGSSCTPEKRERRCGSPRSLTRTGEKGLALVVGAGWSSDR